MRGRALAAGAAAAALLAESVPGRTTFSLELPA